MYQNIVCKIIILLYARNNGRARASDRSKLMTIDGSRLGTRVAR